MRNLTKNVLVKCVGNRCNNNQTVHDTPCKHTVNAILRPRQRKISSLSLTPTSVLIGCIVELSGADLIARKGVNHVTVHSDIKKYTR